MLSIAWRNMLAQTMYKRRANNIIMENKAIVLFIYIYIYISMKQGAIWLQGVLEMNEYIM